MSVIRLKEQSVPAANCSKSHGYVLEERHAPWKVFLPTSGDEPVLSVGMGGPSLASLARSWKRVDVYKSEDCEIGWAAGEARRYGQEYCFEHVVSISALKQKYSAIAINAEAISRDEAYMVMRLLGPGGSVIWVGSRGNMPSVSTFFKEGYYDVRRYAILPPGKGRILVPLGNSILTLNGLNLFRPFRWRKQLALRIGTLAARIGAESAFNAKQAVIVRKPGKIASDTYLLDWLSSQIGIPIVDASVRASWTKLVLQLFDNQGHVVGIAKLADTLAGRRGLERENAALKRFETVPGLNNIVPRSIKIGQWMRHTFQIQTSAGFNHLRCNPHLSAAQLKFLALLSQVDRCEMLLENWPQWRVIWQWAHEGEFASKKEAKSVRVAVECCGRNLANRYVLFHRVHGDFSPWHSMLGANGLKVIDWEESEPHGIPLFDAVHFILVQYAYGKNKELPIERVINDSDFIEKVSLKFKSLGCSYINLNAEIGKLATIYACMVITCPSLRYSLWNL